MSAPKVAVFIDYINMMTNLGWPDHNDIHWLEFYKRLQDFGRIQEVSIYLTRGFSASSEMELTNVTQMVSKCPELAKAFDVINSNQRFIKWALNQNALRKRQGRKPIFRLVTHPLRIHQYRDPNDLYSFSSYGFSCSMKTHMEADMRSWLKSNRVDKVILISHDGYFSRILNDCSDVFIETRVIASLPEMSLCLAKNTDEALSLRLFISPELYDNRPKIQRWPKYKRIKASRKKDTRNCGQRLLRPVLQVA